MYYNFFKYIEEQLEQFEQDKSAGIMNNNNGDCWQSEIT